MRRWILAILILLALSPIVSATSDNFTLRTLFSPTNYLIDYGEDNTAYVNIYWINSSKTLIANQSWYLLGSNDQTTIYELDHQTNKAFTADVGQSFITTSPGYYRYYYLTLDTGFYDTTDELKTIFHSTSNFTESNGVVVQMQDTNSMIPVGLVGCLGLLGLFAFRKRQE